MEKQGKRFDVLAEERKRALLKSQEEAKVWQRQWELQQELANAGVASAAASPRVGSPSPDGDMPTAAEPITNGAMLNS